MFNSRAPIEFRLSFFAAEQAIHICVVVTTDLPGRNRMWPSESKGRSFAPTFFWKFSVAGTRLSGGRRTAKELPGTRYSGTRGSSHSWQSLNRFAYIFGRRKKITQENPDIVSCLISISCLWKLNNLNALTIVLNEASLGWYWWSLRRHVKCAASFVKY